MVFLIVLGFGEFALSRCLESWAVAMHLALSFAPDDILRNKVSS